jgi:hypothetical protein
MQRYSQVNGNANIAKINNLEWPTANTLQVKSKFINDQWLPDASVGSGYYLGNNIVGTAGHCINQANINNYIVVFGWTGFGPGGRKDFQQYQIANIQR